MFSLQHAVSVTQFEVRFITILEDICKTNTYINLHVSKSTDTSEASPLLPESANSFISQGSFTVTKGATVPLQKEKKPKHYPTKVTIKKKNPSNHEKG